MGRTVEYGIRINVEGNKQATTAVNEIRQATSSMGATTEQVSRQIVSSQAAVNQSTSQLTVGQLRFLDTLRDQAAQAGMTRTQLLQFQAAQLGLTGVSAGLITQIEGATQSHHRFSLANAQSTREVMVLAHELGQGRFSSFGSSMMVLANATGATQMLFTATGLAVAGALIPLTAFVAAAVIGSREITKMNEALTITGNFAGMTTGQLRDVANQVGEVNHNVGKATEIFTGLAASGRFSGQALIATGTAATLFAKMTGESAEDVTKRFEKMADGVGRFAEDFDKQYHMLNAATLEHIEHLERQGNKEAAVSALSDAIAKETQTRIDSLKANLNDGQKAWNDIGNAATGAWQKMKGAATVAVGNEPMIQESQWRQDWKAGKMNAQNFFGSLRDAFSGTSNTARIGELQPKIKAQDDKASEDARIAKLQEAGKLAYQGIDKALMEYDKTYRKAQELAQAKKKFMDLLSANPSSSLLTGVSFDGDKISGGAYEQVIAGITKKYQEQGNDTRATALANAVRDNQTAIAEEKRKFDEIGKLADLYHKYGQTGDEQYYQEKRKLALDQEQAQISGLSRELELLQGFHGRTAEERTKNAGAVAAAIAKKTAAENAYQDHLRYLDAESAMRAKKVVSDSDDAMNKYISGLNREADQLETTNAGREATKASVERETVARLDLAIAAQEQFIELQSIGGATREELEQAPRILEYLKQQRDARARIATALDQKDVDDANRKATESATRAWESTARTIKDTLADAIANGGGSAWKKLKAAIVSQALSIPINMISSAGASFLHPGAAQANGSSILGAAQGASSLYSSLASIGTTVTSIGSMVGSATIGAFGSGMSAGFAGASVAEAAAAYSAAGMTGVAGGLSAGASVGSAASSMLGGATSLIAAIPGWGWAALGAAAIAAYLMDDGPEDHTRLGFTSNNTAGNISINERGNEGKSSAYIDPGVSSAFGTFGVSSSFWMSSSSPTVKSFLSTVAQTDDALATFLTATEKASVTANLTGKTTTAHTGAEGTDPNANGELDGVFRERIKMILQGIEPGLDSLVAGFTGTSQALATEATSLLQYRAALKDSGVAVFGATVTLQQIAALKTPTEATSAALTRITAEFNATNQAAALMGKSATEVFGAAGLASLTAREQLLLAAGGADKLNQGIANFSQNFLSEAERLAPVTKAVDAAMTSLGLSSVKTRDQFKQVVLGLDLTTEAGARQYTDMLALAGAFAQVHPEIEAATDSLSQRTELQKQLDSLTLSSTELRARERDTIALTNRDLFDQITARQGLAASSDAIKGTITNLQSLKTGFLNFKDSLLLGSLSTLNPLQREAEARRQYDVMLDKAKNGDAAAGAGIEAAANAWLTASQVVNVSSQEQGANVSKVQSDMTALADLAGLQISDSQRQLLALQQQVTGIGALNDTAIAIRDSLASMTAADVRSIAPQSAKAVDAAVGAVAVPAPEAGAMTAHLETIAANGAALVASMDALREEQRIQTGDIMANAEEATTRAAAAFGDTLGKTYKSTNYKLQLIREAAL